MAVCDLRARRVDGRKTGFGVIRPGAISSSVVNLETLKRGHLTLRITNSKPKKFSDDVWLPMRCVMEEFAPAYAPESPARTTSCHDAARGCTMQGE